MLLLFNVHNVFCADPGGFRLDSGDKFFQTRNPVGIFYMSHTKYLPLPQLPRVTDGVVEVEPFFVFQHVCFSYDSVVKRGRVHQIVLNHTMFIEFVEFPLKLVRGDFVGRSSPTRYQVFRHDVYHLAM